MDILESSDPITLIVMYDLNKADKTQMQKVEEIHAACQSSITKCYILTGSGSEDILTFSMDYPTLGESICTCDPVTLKTIVRANPGVLILQNGVVKEKYNVKNK